MGLFLHRLAHVEPSVGKAPKDPSEYGKSGSWLSRWITGWKLLDNPLPILIQSLYQPPPYLVPHYSLSTLFLFLSLIARASNIPPQEEQGFCPRLFISTYNFEKVGNF